MFDVGKKHVVKTWFLELLCLAMPHDVQEHADRHHFSDLQEESSFTIYTRLRRYLIVKQSETGR